jgi:hypothetical protein
MKSLAVVVLFSLFCLLFSCRANTKSQNVAEAQNETISAQTDAAALSEQTITEIADIPGLTLIPAVEPEKLKNVMPNSWRKLTKLTEAEEQAFVRDNNAVLLKIANIMQADYWGWNMDYYSYSHQTGAVSVKETDNFMAVQEVIIIVWKTFLSMGPLVKYEYQLPSALLTLIYLCATVCKTLLTEILPQVM